MKYGTNAHDLLEHIIDGAKEPIAIDTGRALEVYSFVDYGAAKLVYANTERKNSEGQEFCPFSAGSDQPIDLEFVGVAYQKELMVLRDTDNLVATQISPHTFDSVRDNFSDWVSNALSKRLSDDISVQLSRREYLDYLSGKIDEEQLLSRIESAIVLESVDMKPWELGGDYKRFEETGLVNGKILAHTDVVVGETTKYSSYLVKREDGGRTVYDACVEDNGAIVPVADDAIGLKTEMDAQYRAERYLAEAVRSLHSHELGRQTVSAEKKANKDAIER